MRGRKPGCYLSEEHRNKIANSKVLNRLISHVEGKCDLSATQVTAGIALLRKVMPDISSVALTDADHTGPAKFEITWSRD